MNPLSISFEFFPPQTPEGLNNLSQCQAALIEGLASLCAQSQKMPIARTPHFFSITYGAGGATRDKTYRALTQSQQQFPTVTLAPHLTCVGATRAEIATLIQQYRTQNIRHLVVLRGDLPPGAMGRTAGDFRHAADLVQFIRAESGDHFTIAVAAYPEMHPEAPSLSQDIGYFVDKVMHGADLAITQFFFNVEAYGYFCQKVRERGVSIPILPGIMPIHQFSQLSRFSAQCGAEIPRYLTQAMNGADDETQKLIGINIVANLTRLLIREGAQSLHFYTLNRSALTLSILQEVLFDGLRDH